MRRKIFKIVPFVLLFRPVTLFAVPSAQLNKLIESIQRDEAEYQSQVLKNHLGGVPLDKEILPLKDPASGAINIEGDTPRDKIVTDFLRKIDLVAEKVRETQTKQDELFAKIRSSNGSVSEVIVEFVTISDGKKFFPVNFEIYDKDIKLNSFDSLIASRGSENTTLVRTVLETGKRTLRVKGVFALGTLPEESVFSSRERFSIEQNLDLEVKGPKSRFLYKIVEKEGARSLGQVRDKE